MLELITGLFDIAESWRFYLAVVVAVLIGTALESLLPDQDWRYFVIVPVPLGIIASGFLWQIKTDQKRAAHSKE